MKLITEQIEAIEVISEEIQGKKTLYIQGPFLQADITNRNGRCYPMSILEREVSRYHESFIRNGRALGELGHPSGPTVNLDRVSHMITSLKKEGNNFLGKAKILDTPMGNIAKSLLDEGVKLGVSSRGVGSLVEKNGVKYVGDDFMLSTAADIVADPSAPDAFVSGIMEGKEWVYDTSKKVWIAESIKKIIERDSMQKKLNEKRKLEHFNKFLGSI
jgi:Prohead core protein serine protease